MNKIKDIEQLFRSNFGPMYTLAVRLVHDQDVARDIVHDVFTALLHSPTTDYGTGYLLRATRNGCISYLRNLSVRQRLNGLYALDLSEIENEEWPDEATIAAIEEAMHALPEQCRRVASLRYRTGRSYEEIALELGISKVMVYKHLRRALELIKQKLTQYGQD